MKKHFLSCLLLVLTLICAVFYTAACDNGNGEDDTTTNGDTDAVTTDAVPSLSAADVSRLTQEILTDLAADERSAMLVGHFEKNVGKGEAFMFVGLNNYRFTKDQTASVTFKTADPDAVVTAYIKGDATRLTPDANGVYTVEVVNADAVFVTDD